MIRIQIYDYLGGGRTTGIGSCKDSRLLSSIKERGIGGFYKGL